MATSTLIEFPSPNVGEAGGDLASRRFAVVVLAALALLAAPPLGAAYGTLKIATLIVAMVGTLFLMAGIVFAQKTHPTGLVLIPLPLLMLALAGAGFPWVGSLLGLLMAAGEAFSIRKRFCRLNSLLGVDSVCSEKGRTLPAGPRRVA